MGTSLELLLHMFVYGRDEATLTTCSVRKLPYLLSSIVYDKERGKALTFVSSGHFQISTHKKASKCVKVFESLNGKINIRPSPNLHRYAYTRYTMSGTVTIHHHITSGHMTGLVKRASLPDRRAAELERLGAEPLMYADFPTSCT